MNEALIRIRQLDKSFDGVSVLKGIDASVRPGDVIGLLGLNGAGKTTLLETLLGFCLPDGGSVELLGRDVAARLDPETKARIGFVPQNDELVDNMSGGQYLELIASFYRHWNPRLIERLTGEWKVPLNRRISTLSVGQRQKLSILAALGHEPELLVLDEPVASLDPLARRMFLKELVDISASHRRSILFSTHIVSDLERIANRVWLIRDGGIAIDTELDAIKEHFVRVRLPPDAGAEAALPLRGLLKRRREQGTTVLSFSDWSDATARELRRRFGPELDVETLSLEEIFVELHA